MSKKTVIHTLCAAAMAVTVMGACQNKRSTGLEYARNMYDPLGYNYDQPNPNFKNGQTAQLPPAHTVPVGYVNEVDTLRQDNNSYKAAANLVNPVPVNELNLQQGKHLYTVFCSPCHGVNGDGQGHLVKIEKIAGVPSYHGDDAMSSRGGKMSELQAGKIYHTIKYGLNNMGSYASQLNPTERWKVVMYVQQLQKIK